MRRTLIAIVTCFLAATGCQIANKPPANEAAPTPGQPVRHPEHVEQTAPQPKQNQSPQAKADHLARLATEVPNVKGATAIVAGRYTIVGIDVDPTLDRSRVGTVKYAVAQALKDDPNGANALVTADTDIVQRIREMNEDIRQGRPISGIMEELADIAGRIVPQPSRNVERKEEPPTKLDQERQNQSPNPKRVRQAPPKQR